jgi:hypothetical protein
MQIMIIQLVFVYFVDSIEIVSMLCETNWFATHRERPTDLADW